MLETTHPIARHGPVRRLVMAMAGCAALAHASAACAAEGGPPDEGTDMPSMPPPDAGAGPSVPEPSEEPAGSGDGPSETCEVGAIRDCFTVGDELAGVGACTAGTQRCEPDSEFGGRWGSCEGAGEPLPESCDGMDNDCDGTADEGLMCEPVCDAEVCGNAADDDCDGLVDCDDDDCGPADGCDCLAGGTFELRNLWVCGSTTEGIWSNRRGMTDCGGPWGSGGSLSARCSGEFRVCARVESTESGCSTGEQCVSASIVADGGTATLPPLPGFHARDECGVEAARRGGHICVRVSGTTSDGVRVAREMGCFVPWCGLDDCSGGPGGGGDAGGSF